MLRSLLYPSSVAVMGASRTPGKVGNAVLANLVEGGFEGEIIPVNPHGGELMGLKIYASLEEYGKPIDMSVIAVPTTKVKDAVLSSLKAKAKTVVIITAGFKEVDEAGARLESEIAELCRRHGARLVGPNSLGVINTHHKLNAAFASHMPKAGGISILSQSGALCSAILDWAASRKVGIATLLSMGNKADLSETDFLAAFQCDEDTKVVAGYLESINNGDEFIRVAESLATTKPIVILKGGTTIEGSKAASSHTGALAGADTAYEAAFKRAGIIRADTFESLFDIATAFAMQPLPKGNRVAIITNAGGPGTMAADAVARAGMRMAEIDPQISQALSAKLPAAARVGNPIDVLEDASPARYALAMEAIQTDPGVDALIVILTPQAMTKAPETARAIAESVQANKPVLAAFMGGDEIYLGRQELALANLPNYPSPERAAAALKAMLDYTAWRLQPPRVVARFPVNRRLIKSIISRQLRLERTYLGEVRAKEILRACDFVVPDGRLVSTVEEAIEVGSQLGYPLAMKIVSPDIIHKSDVGGVKLGLNTRREVADSFELMMVRVARMAPQAFLEGVYLERMVPKGREVILGMTRDPQFGPMLMFGLGGVFVDIMQDVTFHLAPITSAEAMGMLVGTRSFRLLEGFRGEEGVDITVIAEALQRISQLVTDFPQIAELDINPFMVGGPGEKPVVVDARIKLAPGGKPWPA
ncbi:MAG: acetate--CoA ligase family protein [Actinobacteria bacterium]|nr:acetate--CoA ligase family protein [Actinomycetota bacterium]